MVNINETPAWEETIKLIERLERVAGGVMVGSIFRRDSWLTGRCFCTGN